MSFIDVLEAALVSRPYPSLGAVLAETGRTKVVIGLDDLSETVLRAAVAAIGVGVKPLHQLLVARLDLGAALGAFEVESSE